VGVFAPLIPLITEGVLSYNEEKEYDNSPEGLKELINDNFATKVEEFKSQYPKEAWDVLEHLKSGGNLNELVQVEVEGPDYENDVDLTDETHQKFVIEDYLAEQGLSEDKIKAKIAKYEEAGLLEEESKTAHERLVELQKRKKEEAVRKQNEVIEARKNNLKTRAEDLKKKVLESKDIAGFELKQGEQQRLLDYMTKPVQDGKTQLQLDYNDDAQLKMAYFLMKKFDFKEVEKKAVTKASIKLKKAVDTAKDTNLNTKGAGSPREKKEDEYTGDVFGLSWASGPKKK
jgi:hypothetical protein